MYVSAAAKHPPKLDSAELLPRKPPELKSLEEPRYLMGEFFKDPASCLTLASYLITNTGDWWFVCVCVRVCVCGAVE